MTATAPGGPPGPTPPEHDLPPEAYDRMAAVLRAGLIVALGLMAVALVGVVGREPASASGAWIVPNPLARYLVPRTLLAGLASGSAGAYLELGVFALIATPVVRVAAGSYTFFRHGERRIGAITTVVLALLVFGLLVLGPLVR